MTQYDFNTNYSVKNSAPNSSSSFVPHGVPDMPSIRQLAHSDSNVNPFDGSDFLTYSTHLEEFLIPAFHSLDDSMKQYWTGIRVPTKDSFRFMRVKIAGGDKSLLVWADDLVEGRAKIPVASLSRGSHKFNSEKFSPRYHFMTSRYLSSRGNSVARVHRPVPFLVDYQMVIWAESKRDAEYILYQILVRFNPIAEFRMFDGKIEGNVQLIFGGSDDASEKEVGHDQNAKVRYEVSFTAEAWLPLPEVIVPTILGRITTVREREGQILLASKSQSVVTGGSLWYEPVQN